ncbi:MAG: hypothetical protein WD513_00335 [Balneolaceae bacterium]
MKQIQQIVLFTLSILILIPSILFGQEVDRDNPFKRDPIFTKPLEELFGKSDHDDADENQKESDDNEFERAVRRVSTTGIDLGGTLEAGPYFSNALYSQYPNLPTWHFNRVNGLFMGIRKERMQWYRYGSFLKIPQIEPHGFIGYGTASKRWDYAIGLEKLVGLNDRLLIGGEYHRAASTEDYHRVGLSEASLTSITAGYDFLDYFMMEGYGLYALFRTNRWIEAGFSFSRNTFSSLDVKTHFSLFGGSGNYRFNPPVDGNSDDIDLDIYGLSFAFNPKRVLISDRFTVSGKVMMELADNSNSDEFYRYNKYQSDISLFYNFEPGSILKWKVQAASITGNAPDFKKLYLGGIGTLRGSPYKFFSGNRMIASNLEIQFGRPSSRAGQWIRDYNLHLVLFLDSGWVDHTDNAENALKGFSSMKLSDFQQDAGVGIGSGALRFELAWPLKTFDSSPTFWVRFNPTF